LKTFKNMSSKRGKNSLIITFSLLISILLLLRLDTYSKDIIGQIDHPQYVPEWAVDAIWYQIFPERYCNGDKENDPTIETLDGTWPYNKQEWWEIIPWGSDWYKLQPWEKHNNKGFYYNAQLRRYGGDIQGIINKIDYLDSLGITAVYLNPIFESPSSHKYGCAMYRHVDNNFGPNPEYDEIIWNSEVPDDPSTWKWTSADTLFLSLIRKLHKREIKIIIDGVFNHVGIPFWALQDVKKNGKKSKYYDWFIIYSLDNPETEENEFRYQGWDGIPDLPEIKEDENGPPETFKKHIFNVVKRWMDPNGDGNPEDGIDGWRLDVAEKVNINFWKEFRSYVKSINPDCYIVGEVWWENFRSNKMFDASPWLNPGVFDGVMNYRFADAMLKAFVDKKLHVKPSGLDRLLGFVRTRYPVENQYVLQNLMDSHDTERLLSMITNPDRMIDHDCHLEWNKNFNVSKPGKDGLHIARTILLFQFTYIGAPYIYYGDEVGMWGADDPDCRKPMLWPDIIYEPECHHPFGLPRKIDTVKVDTALFNYYKQLINLRKKYIALRRGSYKTILTDDDKELFVFERKYDSEVIIAVFNLSNKPSDVKDLNYFNNGKNWRLVFQNGNFRKNLISPKSGFIFKKV